MRNLILKISRFLLIMAFSFFVLIVIPYGLAYRDKIIPGVMFRNINLSNRSFTSALILVEEYLGIYRTYPITLLSGEMKIKVPQEEFGLAYDPEATVNRALRTGRQGTIFERISESYTAWFRGVEIKPVYKVNYSKFSEAIHKIAKNIYTPAVEARFVWQENTLVIIPSSSGNLVRKEELVNLIIRNFEEINFEPIEIPVGVVGSKITEPDLEAIKPVILDLVTNPPRLRYEETLFVATPEQVLSFLELKKTKVSAKLEIGTNSESLENHFLSLAREIDVEAKGGVFNFNGDRVTAFELPEDGKSLNIQKAVSLYSEELLSSNGSSEINLPVEIVRASSVANEYGVRELLGEGGTNFRGSMKGRSHNIGLASERLRGILVPPGKTFSFNESVGEISAETGYDLAYIIKERRTVLGPGGGVCQVSTTLFRAAFNAGLPIVERYPHAYRVHYYEPPVGFDASVYAPYTDLKFKNDTLAYILIFSYFEPGKYTLTFQIFGTKDGREVKIEGPVIENTTPPPEPLYQEDTTLAPGEVKQVDFAAAGAKVTVKRSVIRNGEILINETLRSVYSPWQAVYLVGVEE